MHCAIGAASLYKISEGLLLSHVLRKIGNSEIRAFSVTQLLVFFRKHKRRVSVFKTCFNKKRIKAPIE